MGRSYLYKLYCWLFLLVLSLLNILCLFFLSRWYAPYMELFRCLLFLIVDLVLSSQNLDTGGILWSIFLKSNDFITIDTCNHSTASLCKWKSLFLIYLFVIFFYTFSVLPTAYIGVIRGIFIGSAFLWITSSLVSKNKAKIEWCTAKYSTTLPSFTY